MKALSQVKNIADGGGIVKFFGMVDRPHFLSRDRGLSREMNGFPEYAAHLTGNL
jgi:hypothetical protein